LPEKEKENAERKKIDRLIAQNAKMKKKLKASAIGWFLSV
jgi:hypothetical protein